MVVHFVHFLHYTCKNQITTLTEQDGVPHAHALLVWGKCSRRLSGLHTGFTDFSCFRYFSHGSTWEYTGVLFNSFLIASDGKEKMWASADHCKPSDFCVMSERTRRQYGVLLCVRVQIIIMWFSCNEWSIATRKIAAVSLYSLVICWLGFWWRSEGFVTQTWTEKYCLFSSNAINTCHSKWLSRKLVSITHLFC